MVTT
ncbi:hypothetical protein SUNI508_14123, partial [Seiridium unicorne]|jgi:fused-like protein